MTYIGWREKARIIMDVVETMAKYEEEWISSEVTSEDDEIVVKKEAALEIIGYSQLMEKLVLLETRKDLEKAITYANDQVEEKTHSGHGWDADVWQDVSTILGHHL